MFLAGHLNKRQINNLTYWPRSEICAWCFAKIIYIMCPLSVVVIVLGITP